MKVTLNTPQSESSHARRPPLLFYTHALVGGGAERVWAQTAAGLFERGYPVEFCVDWDASENAHLLPEKMIVHRLGRNHALATWRLARILRRGGFFAGFSGVGASNLKLLAAAWLAWSRVKIIMSQHGHFEAESRFLGTLGYRLTPILSRLANRTVVVSDALRNDLIARFQARASRVVRIYNAIALPDASRVPSKSELAARDPLVLAAGRLVPEKGHADLLSAVATMDPSVRLIIAGQGPERAALERLIEDLKLGARVTLAGYVADLSPLYLTAKVLALSSYTEAFGNVVVEALGHGLPVVSTNCGGPAEILADGMYGRIVPVGKVADMANALKQAFADPGDPAEHRRRAELFSTEKILDEYEELLAELNGQAK